MKTTKRLGPSQKVRNPTPPTLAGGPGPDGARSVECAGAGAPRVLAASELRLEVLRQMYRAGLRMPLRLVSEIALTPRVRTR